MRRLLLLLLCLLGCPKVEPEDAAAGPTATTTELPKFDLSKSKALPVGDAGTTIFDKPCEDPAQVKCKP